MPRSNAAQQWKPDPFGQYMIDKIANYHLASERCAEELRSFDYFFIAELRPKVRSKFNGDSVKYPSGHVPYPHDKEGLNQFHAKCEALCYPPESQRPRDAEGIILMFFATYAGVQCTSSGDLVGHPFRHEIAYRGNLEAAKQLGHNQDTSPTAAFESQQISHNNTRAIDLLDETFSCIEKGSDKIVKYTVVDCGTSMVGGHFVVLEDEQGQRKQVSPEELDEIMC